MSVIRIKLVAASSGQLVASATDGVAVFVRKHADNSTAPASITATEVEPGEYSMDVTGFDAGDKISIAELTTQQGEALQLESVQDYVLTAGDVA